MPDADVIPFGQPGDPERGGSATAPLGPSKAARLVGNTGPQPTAPGVPARTQPRVPSVATTGGAAAVHAGDAPAPHEVWTDDEIPLDEGWLDFVRRRMSGDYGVDDFGFDPELTDKVFLALMRPLYRSWFRVETTGLENVPSDSGALIVGNHSGVIALDAAMTQVALHDEHPAHRHLRMLGANLVFQMPVMGEIARKAGHTLACHPDAERLLGAGELVGVWPEGFKGVGKPFSQTVQAAALRPGRLRRGRPAHPGADHPDRDRRRGGDLPDGGQRQDGRAHPRAAVLPDHADVPVARAARDGPAAEQVAHPLRGADPDGPLPRGRCRRPDGRVQPDRPGARADPAVAVPAAGQAAVRVRLRNEPASPGSRAPRARVRLRNERSHPAER